MALAIRAAGPLAAHLGPWVRSLINTQYVVAVVYVKARWLVLNGPVATTPTDDLAAGFGHHLQHHQQGLADSTVERYGTVVRQFLTERLGRGAVDLELLSPSTSSGSCNGKVSACSRLL